MKKVFKSLKFLYVLIVLYFLPISLFAQSPVNVTATVKDSAGIPYSNATVSILLIPTGTAPTVGGAQISGTNNGQLDVNGKLNVSLYKNTDIVPASSQWQFTICETPGVAPPLGTGGQCFTSSQTVSAAVDFSTQFQAAAKALTTVTVGGSGSVTHTAGNLTAGNVVIGNGAADVKVDSACVTNGTGALSGCTSLSAGSGASAAGATATGGFACVEAASTGWTPTVGQDYQRCDSTAHAFVCSNNGAAESACSPAPSFPVTVGGTVTSGGIPYFNSTVQESSSALLAANALMVGGGAGAAPATGNADFTLPPGSHTLTVAAAGIIDLHTNTGVVFLAPGGPCTNNWTISVVVSDLNELCYNDAGGSNTIALAARGGAVDTTCTNKVITAISGHLAPTCTPLSEFVTSDYTNATTTLSNVTGLAVPLAASTNYAISCKLIYQGSAGTASLVLSSTGPASPTKVTGQVLQDTTAGAGAAVFSQATDGTTFGFTLGAAAIVTTATDLYSTIDIGVMNGVNAGTFQLQAKANGAGTVTIKQGSFCKQQ